MYILYSSTGSYDSRNKEVYETFEEAKSAYDSCPDAYKFLYQPDETYFLGTISVTGYKVGRDHSYHKDTAKAYGLFTAKNKSQVAKFLDSVGWKHLGASKSSKARLYGNGPYGSLYRVNRNSSDVDWTEFERALYRDYFRNNIIYPSMLDSGFGAVDVASGQPRRCPYEMY